MSGLGTQRSSAVRSLNGRLYRVHTTNNVNLQVYGVIGNLISEVNIQIIASMVSTTQARTPAAGFQPEGGSQT